MANTKWTIEEVSVKGHQALGLCNKYQSNLQPRISIEEIAELENGIRELETRRAGQKGNLQGQKSATKSKDDITKELHFEVMDVRNLVKAGPGVKQEILKAFGVGTKTGSDNQPKTIAAANLIIAGYNKYNEWALNKAKILEEDIINIESLRNQLLDADKIQEQVKLNRKLGTVDKNTLQLRLEQLITQISAVGVKVFRSSNSELVPLFQTLIPGSGSDSTENTEEKQEETVPA